MRIIVYYAFLWKIQYVTSIEVYVVNLFGRFWLEFETTFVIAPTFHHQCIFSVIFYMFDLKYHRLEQDLRSFKVWLAVNRLNLMYSLGIFKIAQSPFRFTVVQNAPFSFFCFLKCALPVFPQLKYTHSIFSGNTYTAHFTLAVKWPYLTFIFNLEHHLELFTPCY